MKLHAWWDGINAEQGILRTECSDTQACMSFRIRTRTHVMYDNNSELCFYHLFHKPGRVAQSVARLTQEPEVPGSVLGPAYLSFLLPLIQEGQLLVTGESTCMCTKNGLTA